MANATIRPVISGSLKKIYSESNSASIKRQDSSSKILEISYKTKNIKNANFTNSIIFEENNVAKISATLPFRVKFTNITIPGYSMSNPAPIGIAIIGVNNYIL